jgi:uncharacterized protein YdeI (YjbR/CyaY-like superfamily)
MAPRYRSSLMKYGAVFHLGVHKATLAEAGVKPADLVRVSIELDDEPQPADSVPPELERALKQDARARAAWQVLRPSGKREHGKSVTSAKKPVTRARRIEKILVALKGQR